MNQLSETKKSFYDLINKVLLKVEIPRQMATLIMVINTVQNFPFLFDLLGASGLSSEFSKIVIDSIKMLRPVELISKLQLGGLIIWILILLNSSLMIYLGSTILFFWKYHSIRKSRNMDSQDLDRVLENNFIKVFYTTLVFFNLCLVNPISEILMQPFFCDKNILYERFDISLRSYPNTDRCYSTVRFILVFMSSINVLFMASVSFICCFFFVKNTYDPADYLARDNTSMEWIMLIKKVSLIVVTMPIKIKNFGLISLIFQLFIQSVEVHHYLTDHTFYMYITHKIFGVAAITELLFVILILIGRMLNQIMGIQLNIYIILILLALFTKLSLKTVDWMDSLTIKSQDSKLGRSMIERKYKMIYFLLKNYWSESSNLLVTPHTKIFFLINQYISDHFNNCKRPGCPCESANKGKSIYDPVLGKYTVFDIDDVNGPAKFLMNMTYVRKLISHLTKVAINERFPKSNSLKVFYSNFLFYEEGQMALSTLSALTLIKNHLDSREWFCCYRLLDSIKLVLDDMNRNHTRDPEISNINLNKMLDMEKNYADMETYIINYVDKYSSFLFQLTDKNIFCKDLIKTYNEFYQSKEKLDSIFFKTDNYMNPRSINLYLNYVYHYNSDYKMRKKLKKRLKLALEKLSILVKNEKSLTVAQLYNEDSSLIQVDASFEKYGKILSVNKGAELLTGYTIEQLEYNKIELIIPNGLAPDHEKYVSDYLSTGYMHFLYRENNVFLKHKDGYLIPCFLLVKPMVDLITQKFFFNCLVNKIDDIFKYIICDKDGIIRDISQKAANYMTIDPLKLVEAQIPIYLLCPNLMDFFSIVKRNHSTPLSTFKKSKVKLTALSAFKNPAIANMQKEENEETKPEDKKKIKMKLLKRMPTPVAFNTSQSLDPLSSFPKNSDGDCVAEFRLDSNSNMKNCKKLLVESGNIMNPRGNVVTFKSEILNVTGKWKKFYDVGFRAFVNEGRHHCMVVIKIRTLSKKIELMLAQTKVENVLKEFFKHPKKFKVRHSAMKNTNNHRFSLGELFKSSSNLIAAELDDKKPKPSDESEKMKSKFSRFQKRMTTQMNNEMLNQILEKTSIVAEDEEKEQGPSYPSKETPSDLEGPGDDEEDSLIKDMFYEKKEDTKSSKNEEEAAKPLITDLGDDELENETNIIKQTLSVKNNPNEYSYMNKKKKVFKKKLPMKSMVFSSLMRNSSSQNQNGGEEQTNVLRTDTDFASSTLPFINNGNSATAATNPYLVSVNNERSGKAGKGETKGGSHNNYGILGVGGSRAKDGTESGGSIAINGASGRLDTFGTKGGEEDDQRGKEALESERVGLLGGDSSKEVSIDEEGVGVDKESHNNTSTLPVNSRSQETQQLSSGERTNTPSSQIPKKNVISSNTPLLGSHGGELMVIHEDETPSNEENEEDKENNIFGLARPSSPINVKNINVPEMKQTNDSKKEGRMRRGDSKKKFSLIVGYSERAEFSERSGSGEGFGSTKLFRNRTFGAQLNKHRSLDSSTVFESTTAMEGLAKAGKRRSTRIRTSMLHKSDPKIKRITEFNNIMIGDLNAGVENLEFEVEKLRKSFLKKEVVPEHVMDNDGKTPGSPDRRDSIRTIQKMINQEDFNQELDQQINAFESGADYKRVPDTNHGVLTKIENIEEGLSRYMSSYHIDIKFLQQFFKNLDKKFPESITLRIKKQFIQANLQRSNASSIIMTSSLSNIEEMEETNSANHNRIKNKPDGSRAIKQPNKAIMQNSYSVSSTQQEMSKSSYHYPMNMSHTPPLAYKYASTFILTIVLTVMMYLTYWYLMLEIYGNILNIFSGGHYITDIIETLSLVRDDSNDIILINLGLYEKMDVLEMDSLEQLIHNNMGLNLNTLDNNMALSFLNNDQFDPLRRFLRKEQVIQFAFEDMLVNLEPITALSIANKAIYGMWTGNEGAKIKNNTEKVGFAKNLSFLYDSIIGFREKDYFLKPYKEDFITSRVMLIIYLYLGSLLIFFILTFYRITYHIDIYKCKSNIFELMSKLTDHDINEINQNSVKQSFSLLDPCITINEDRYKTVRNFILKKIDNFYEQRVKKHSSQRRTKNFNELKKPICGIVSYHLITFVIFTCFSFVFLIQMNVFDNFFSSLHKIHYHFFKKTRIYIDTYAYTKLKLASKFYDFETKDMIPTEKDLFGVIKKMRQMENIISSQAEDLNEKYTKAKYQQLSYSNICGYRLLEDKLPFDFKAECPYLLNGRLKAGLYPTQIELLNKLQMLVNNYQVATEDYVKNMLVNSQILEIKKTLEIMYVLLNTLRKEVTLEINGDYYDYIQYNLGLVMGYTVIILILIMIDCNVVYLKEKAKLMRAREILLFFPPSLISSNAYTETLQTAITQRKL